MPAVNSTTSSRPSKPYPEFPLYAHTSGRWAKKIRGKTHFFGPWRDPHAALRRYLNEKDDLEAGRQARRAAGVTDALTVQQMVGLFLDAKEINVQSGELELSTWKVYESFGNRMIRVFGANTPVQSLGRLTSRTSARIFKRPTKAWSRSTATSARSRRSSTGLDLGPMARATSTGSPALGVVSSGPRSRRWSASGKSRRTASSRPRASALC